jgi:DNA-binding transcriptional ArsR family regulator
MKFGCRSKFVGLARVAIILIFLILFFSSNISAQVFYPPEREFATEVVLNKQEVEYDLSLFDPHIEVETVYKDEFDVYIYRSHYDRDLGVVIYEVDEAYAGLKGLSISLVIPTEWVEEPGDDPNQTEPIMVLESTVDLDPTTLAWDEAMKTELEWLVDQSIIIGLTQTDIQDIASESGSGYAGWDYRVVHENGQWLPYNETQSPFEVFSGIYQLDKDILPNTVPYPLLGDGEPEPEVTEDEDYTTLVYAGALTAIVLLGAFSYSRLKRRSVLDNLNRKNIFEQIKTNPGVHFNQLLRDLDMQPGSMSYHLNVLEKKEYVKSIQDGNYRRFFLYGASTDFKIALTSIQLRILSIVDKKPGITQAKISRSIGKNRMLVNYHIKILRDAGILSVEKSGRETLCYTTSAAMVYLA